MRRLQGEIEGRSGEYGVAVLMRYTLRFLTLQQFQRATALMCAAEKIRRDAQNIWGKNPFRIGLWVGYSTTALSVTPFVTGALDRGLAGIFVALIRLMAEKFNENSAAQDFDPYSDIVKQAIDIITERANSIEDNPQIIKEIRQLLESKVNQWVKDTKQVSRQLVYNRQVKGNKDSVVELLKPAGAGKMSDFTTLNSLRDVEPSVGLILDISTTD